MSEEPEERRLIVLARSPREPDRWDALVGDVEALSDARAAGERELVEGAGERPPAVSQEILERAIDTPLLVLPSSDPSAPPGEPARVRTILVPMDRTLTERRSLRPLIERAQEREMDVRQVHVLGPAARPAMWEGSGHHAEAWYEELRRRHQPEGTELAVVGGDPVERIVSAGQEADLLVICWRCNTAAGRAGVVRAVVDRVDRPILLMPVRPARRGGQGAPE